MKVNKYIRNLDKYIGAFFLMLLISMIIIQVVMRYFFSSPIIGTGELGRYFLIWIIFISAPYATRSGSHIKMEEFQSILPAKVRHILQLFTYLCAITVFGIIGVSAISTTIHNLSNTTPTLEIPSMLFFFPTISGFVLLTIEYIILFIKYVKDFKNGLYNDLEDVNNEDLGGV